MMASGYAIGTTVHYVAYNLRHLAAIIIGLNEDGSADLVVFTNMLNVNNDKNFGMQFHQNIFQDDAINPGTWHWIEGCGK